MCRIEENFLGNFRKLQNKFAKRDFLPIFAAHLWIFVSADGANYYLTINYKQNA
jgi:hypothetical protein